jgi:hypothetical protein
MSDRSQNIGQTARCGNGPRLPSQSGCSGNGLPMPCESAAAHGALDQSCRFRFAMNQGFSSNLSVPVGATGDLLFALS